MYNFKGIFKKENLKVNDIRIHLKKWEKIKPQRKKVADAWVSYSC